MKQVKFTVYGPYGDVLMQDCEYTPMADIRTLKDYTTGEITGLGIHPESAPVPGRAAVHYMGKTMYMPSGPAGFSDCRYRLHLGETVRCGDWKLELKDSASFLALLKNLETEYYCQA